MSSKQQLSKPEQYVAARHALDSLWADMSAVEREEAETGIKWLHVIGNGGGNGKRSRGRPKGSRNHKSKIEGANGEHAENLPEGPSAGGV